MPDPRARVLVVDDDTAVGVTTGALLGQAGFDWQHVLSAEAALKFLERDFADLVLTDVRMAGMDGLELLRRIRVEYSETPVVVMTAFATVSMAVEAMRAGAADYVEKPVDRDVLLPTIRRALELGRGSSATGPPPSVAEGALVGKVPAMQKALETLKKAAGGSATVLLRGETGTGKGLAARTLHDLSPRKKKPFIDVQCAALPETLIESELFGREAGAYTDAKTRKPGRVELAEGGTLFLDEIGDLSLSIQVKLLHLVQDKVYQPLGGTRERQADVRFVTATHRDLEAMVKRGEFRRDLFYRLNVVEVWLPPLRERTEEIEPLAAQFCARFGPREARPRLHFSGGALSALRAYSWPGNVRELENLVERLAVLSEQDEITEHQVREELDKRASLLTGGPSGSSRGPGASASGPSDGGPGEGLEDQIAETERRAIREALRKTRGNHTKAAKLLNISRRTLYNKKDALGLRDEKGEEGRDDQSE